MESKLSNSQMMFKAQEQELANTIAENDNKQKEIKLLQQQIEDEERRFKEENNMLKSLHKEL